MRKTLFGLCVAINMVLLIGCPRTADAPDAAKKNDNGGYLSNEKVLAAWNAWSGALAALSSLTPVIDPESGTYTLTGNGVVYTYQIISGTPTLHAGKYVFDNYYDSGTDCTINGELNNCMVMGTPIIYEYTGTLLYSGESISSVGFDYSMVGSTMSGTMTIDGVAYDIMTYSPVTGTVTTPVIFSVPTGVYGSPQSVSLEFTGASIYYTLDGSEPSSSSTSYNGSPITISETTILRAIAIKDGITSRVTRAVYIISDPQPDISSPIPVENLASYLASLDDNDAEHPHTVELEPVNISDTMGAINSAVTGKYVILDLSTCFATNGAVRGSLTPTGNDMNIIRDNKYIKGIILPESVTSIEVSAFSRCSGLTSMTIPSSVSSIGVSAFSCCSGLTSVTISSSVSSIGQGAFYGCSGLTSVAIPSSVTSIGVSAFSCCSGLTSVTVSSSVSSIGEGAFYGCSGLTSVTFETNNISEENFGGTAFPGGDNNLRTVYLTADPHAGTYTLDSGGDSWMKE